jgi:hypothetical protein
MVEKCFGFVTSSYMSFQQTLQARHNSLFQPFVLFVEKHCKEGTFQSRPEQTPKKKKKKKTVLAVQRKGAYRIHTPKAPFPIPVDTSAIASHPYNCPYRN